MLTTVQSLRVYRIQDADPARDVRITRPGPWGNQFSVARHGVRMALDRYRELLRGRIATANTFTGGVEAQTWLRQFKALAGKILWCACTPEAIRHGACHGAVLAKELEELTGVGYELAPGTEEED